MRRKTVRMGLRLTGTLMCLLIAASFAVNAGVRVGPDPVPEPARARLGTPPRASATAARARTASTDRTSARPAWVRRIDRLTRNRAIGVSIRSDDEVLYERRAQRRRIPASNQKLLLAMVLLESFDRRDRIPTIAAAAARRGDVVAGDLWLLGRGDPSVTGGGAYAKSLPFPGAGLTRLARNIAGSGVTRITGSVMGGTGSFARDWWAPGWKDYFPVYYVPLPTALTFNGNGAGGRHIADPERRAARSLTRKLRKEKVRVAGAPGAGVPPARLAEVSRIESAPLEKLLRYMSRTSSNFFAEVLGKRAGVVHAGAPGTITKGAAAIAHYASERRATVDAHDSSGLSYSNRISTRALARLLDGAEEEAWGDVLRRILPAGGQGTLKKRLRDVRVRAKTGTLIGHSSLSGYVWAERRAGWISFSIISSGMNKYAAAALEDKIVTVLARRAL